MPNGLLKKEVWVLSLVLVQPPKFDAQAWFAQAWLFFCCVPTTFEN